MHVHIMPPRLLQILSLAAVLLCGTAVRAQDLEPAAIVRCKGHGRMLYQGSGIVHIGGDALLRITSADPELDVIFSADATDSDEDYAPPACIPAGENSCVYLLSESRVWINGTQLEVSCAGANIGFTASGNAALFLQGYGIYRTGTTLGRWTPEGVTLFLRKE